MRSLKIAVAAFALVVIPSSVRVAVADPVLTFFPNSAYNPNTAVMDATFSTTGRPTDNFETTTFLPGLSIVLSGGVPTTVETSLPALFNGDAFSTFTSNQFWDGTDTATNAIGNVPNSISSPTNIANLTTFNYAPGTLSFGIGLSNFQSINSPQFPVTQHELFVNGVDLGILENLAGVNWTPGLFRNAYLRIDDNVLITSVGFENINQPPSQQDFLMFDHLTVAASASPLPEPGYLLLLGVWFVGMVGVCRRKLLRPLP